jgi:phage baseplate assembly protein W
MSSGFLGAGWAFPVQPEDGGGVALAEGEESVRQSVLIILGTTPGERVMRPDFGCGLADLVFSVGGANAAGAAAVEVERALTLWEPRLDVVAVDATFDEAGETLAIRVEYRVRATNTVFNLVYPYYLEQRGL